MPGIGLKLTGLSVLALLFSVPAIATESGPSIQILEWSGESASGTLDSESTAEAGQDDVWAAGRSAAQAILAASFRGTAAVRFHTSG